MDNDDKPVGLILSRRDALKILGIGGAAFLASCAAPEMTSTFVATQALTQASATQVLVATATQLPGATAEALSCVVRPEMTIGPYFADEQLNRSDIRTDSSTGSISEGLPLALTIGVFDVSQNSCNPIEGAQVDIWHCDAQGLYSSGSGQDFLRGYQITDATGKVQFMTIYPGWYSGRAVHIHFTIRTKAADGADYQFTSQFFFDDTLSDQVHAQEPYASKGQRNMRNSADNIFMSGGDQLLLNLEGDTTNGFTSTFNLGLDLTDMETGASDSAGGPPP